MKTRKDRRHTGIDHHFAWDRHDDDHFYSVSEQDVAPVIDQVKMYQDDEGASANMRHVAEIPMIIVQKMMADGSWGDPAAMKKFLNDPDNDCFRVWRGKV